MPIKSYLVHPQESKKHAVIEMLSRMQQCDVVVAENENILVLVTETESKEEEANLKEALEKIGDIKLMALVSGFDTRKKI
ncbi:chaperone NapD [Eudoraea chungangensis]|uniref:chaperone NapD n=1 Tax=Eudoraea chungangensis TaxID=1481905 RepID=UPI0023EC7770|nr:chaperone NapD [Eudoraea chungangensis]